MLHGVSRDDFDRHYAPVCQHIEIDNRIGKGVFAMARTAQKYRFARDAIVRMAAAEQEKPPEARRMSMILWDMFTGSASYREIVKHAAHPRFMTGLAGAVGSALLSLRRREGTVLGGHGKRGGELGRVYQDGEEILRQGEIGNCMYVIQDGSVEVIKVVDGKHLRVAELGRGEFFGEMALFERIARSATVRAVGRARVLTIDKAALLARIQEDPGLALRMLEKLCTRVRVERMQAPVELPEGATHDTRVDLS